MIKMKLLTIVLSAQTPQGPLVYTLLVDPGTVKEFRADWYNSNAGDILQIQTLGDEILDVLADEIIAVSVTTPEVQEKNAGPEADTTPPAASEA